MFNQKIFLREKTVYACKLELFLIPWNFQKPLCPDSLGLDLGIFTDQQAKMQVNQSEGFKMKPHKQGSFGIIYLAIETI